MKKTSISIFFFIIILNTITAQQISSDLYTNRVIEEDFKKIGETFKIITSDENYFIIDNDDYLLSRNNNSSEYAIIANNSSVRDFILKTSIRIGPSKNKEASIGIILKAQDDGKGAIIFEINKRGEYRIKQLKGLTYYILGDKSVNEKSNEWKRNKSINLEDKHNLIEIRSEKNNYDIYINSNYLTSFFVDDYQSGFSGLLISPATKARIAFFYIDTKKESISDSDHQTKNIISTNKIKYTNGEMIAESRKISELKNTINKQKINIDSLNNNLLTLNKKLNNNLTETKTINSKIEEINSENANLISQKEKLNNEVKDLTDQYNTLNSITSKQENTIQEISKENKELKEKNKKENNKIKQANKENNDLKEQITKRETEKEEIKKKYEKDKQEMINKKNKLNKKIKQKENTIKKLEISKNELETSKNKLSKQISSEEKSHKNTIQDLEISNKKLKHLEEIQSKHDEVTNKLNQNNALLISEIDKKNNTIKSLAINLDKENTKNTELKKLFVLKDFEINGIDLSEIQKTEPLQYNKKIKHNSKKKEITKKIIYTVQFGVYLNTQKHEKLENIGETWYEKTSKGTYLYFSGKFSSPLEAYTRKKLLSKMGYENTFVKTIIK